MYAAHQSLSPRRSEPELNLPPTNIVIGADACVRQSLERVIATSRLVTGPESYAGSVPVQRAPLCRRHSAPPIACRSFGSHAISLRLLSNRDRDFRGYTTKIRERRQQ
jgi:hypothetical protein